MLCLELDYFLNEPESLQLLLTLEMLNLQILYLLYRSGTIPAAKTDGSNCL